ncbi:selenocysteine-specific translation elongation factor [Desulfotalea psychrophila]|uniref:Selenocysteine-specific elongation factor n=1 Tax=Desulfotalea psychrophila (strain LSv54 / DSM 12343) TaxID=177439 RepID=Q6AJ18_DESPS|nr:selenocysteine-specific translation elongation factor [Desulfotalea psychrophila]CAG37662.1 probable selenocysteine-specific elongation factor (SelB) [Desulfotalea psychrophila LSv54]
MREIVLGTAGHVDHGKTSFVRALTGIETDRLKEEKKRGITIELGFAYMDLPCGHRLGIVDVPGHEKFVKNMVAGVSGMDILAFIIAADEGIMPQTKEHFEICQLMGVKQGLIILTKKDLVDPDWLEMVEEEIREFCQGSFLEDAPILPVSSASGEGLDEVRDVLDELVKRQSFNEIFGSFRLAVDRVFAMKGFGAVVTGTSLSGRAALGDELRFYPGELVAKVRGLQVHSEAVDYVEAGHRTAINLQGVDIADIARGMVLAHDGSLQATYMLDCEFLYIASNSKALKHRARVRVHLGTAEIMGRISLLDRDELQPGDETMVQVLLEEQVAVWPGDRFVVRSYSPVVTIGGGTVLGNVSPRKRKRVNEADRQKNIAAYHCLKVGDYEEKILFFLKDAGMTGLCLDDIGVRLGLFAKQLKKVIAAPLSSRRMIMVDPSLQRYIFAEYGEQLKDRLILSLVAYHKENPLQAGIAKEELRSGLGARVDAKLFNWCLADLVRKDVLVQEDSLVHMASHEVALKADEEELQRDLLVWYQQRGTATPTIRETMDHFADYSESLVKEVLALQLREGKLVKISETLYYAKEIIDELSRQIEERIQRLGEIDAPGMKELSGLSRKFSIPILEYFDRVKLTMRVGDKRILRRKA